MKVNSNYAYTFDDVLLKPQYSTVNSRSNVDTSLEIVPGLKLESPIMPANMQTVNSVELAVAIAEAGGMATIDQFRSIENQVDMVGQIKSKSAKVAGAIGATGEFLERAEALVKVGADLIILDTPHAHSKLAGEAIKKFKEKFPEFPLIAGNVATKAGALFLAHLGVAGIKVGIGPGAACTTRVQTGSGSPQITAIIECATVAKKFGISVIADGGIKTPGSFAKAIASGGTVAYMGSIFAGTDEAPSKLVEKNGKKYKEYFGSSSQAAKVKRANDDEKFTKQADRFVEGAVGFTPYQGSVASVVEKYMMGLKSAMSYSGAHTISEFHENAEFMLVTTNGRVENGAHNVVQV
jgi:IMP dehydrogenase